MIKILLRSDFLPEPVVESYSYIRTEAAVPVVLGHGLLSFHQ